MPQINPTVGRVVLYHPSDEETNAAIIAGVNEDGTINLASFDSGGGLHPRQNVQLVQQGDERGRGPWSEWMPYQLGQAAKTEQAEAQLEEGQSEKGAAE